MEEATGVSEHDGIAHRPRRGKRLEPVPPGRILDAQKQREGRDRIAAAAFPLFLEFGYDATTVRRIAAAVGMSVGGIFNYFERKEDVLHWIIRGTQEQLEGVVTEAERELAAMPQSTPPVEIFRSTFRRFVCGVRDIRHYVILSYQETKVLSPEQRESLFVGGRYIADLLRAAVEPGIAAGVFPAQNVTLKLHWLILLAHGWVLRHWEFGRYRFEDYAEALTNLAVTALRSDVGTVHEDLPLPKPEPPTAALRAARE
ncbi:MAG: TetR/AcrR family transcriptional regulator [Deltaproteobacteria bacterium]|nr:TetR/AcrR family transcriptional regulator [Deltaproteobacteria bacterium]